MNVNDIVQQRIEAARRKAEADRKRREELARARAKGVTKRHATKLRRLAEKGFALAPTLDLSNESTAASSA
ncbi:hypothetical protein [Streptomyces cavernae]|uniref:hypothetical protein n=1 Tax=Streptomyces cavernae TaxID=2259034 RepID=UPI000FEB96C5|nr:hypothetical protein [Streptomyces cavernae]